MTCDLCPVALILLRLGTKINRKLLAGYFRVILKEKRSPKFISYLSDTLRKVQRYYLSQCTVPFVSLYSNGKCLNDRLFFEDLELNSEINLFTKFREAV
jgi:hypothetical protein